jgi:hypothetical protein
VVRLEILPPLQVYVKPGRETPGGGLEWISVRLVRSVRRSRAVERSSSCGVHAHVHLMGRRRCSRRPLRRKEVLL